MKSAVNLALAAALFATMTFAAPSDPAFEERFRIKTGRYTVAEEARRLAAATQPTENRCALPEVSCCKRDRDHATAALPANAMETWRHAKLGQAAIRTTPAAAATPATCCD